MTSIIKQQSCRCRCNRWTCQSRRTLPKHPDEYVRRPKCRSCGKGFYRVDKYRTDGREQSGHTCRCDLYSFPHYKGRGFCEHNHAITPRMMQEREQTKAWA